MGGPGPTPKPRPVVDLGLIPVATRTETRKPQTDPREARTGTEASGIESPKPPNSATLMQVHPRMNLRPSSLANASIASRLLFWFLAIALVPSIILTVVTAYLSRRSVEISVHDRLMVIADAKTTQLENFIRERRGTSRCWARPRCRQCRRSSWRARQGRQARFGRVSPRRGVNSLRAGGFRTFLRLSQYPHF